MSYTPTGSGWVDTLILVGFIAGALTAIVVLARTILGFRPVRWLFQQVISRPVSAWAQREIGEIVNTRMDPTIALVKTINKEMHPNNGSTMRDAVDQVIENQHRQRDDLYETRKDLRAMTAKVDELHTYTHAFRHDALSKFAGFEAADTALHAVVTKLGEVVAELQANRAAVQDNTQAVKQARTPDA